ncbi:MAG: flavodoxin family protein [Treponema sp.]|nr:flavodoxin family protein [Treponema sp.]
MKGKKALALIGSPRKNGATMGLLRCFMDQWETRGGGREDVTVINAYQPALKPCIHCGYCKQNRGCVYQDFEPIDRSLRKADLLVIASPVYGLGFPAPLKAVFDRTQQYFEAKRSLGIPNPIEKHKPALFLAAFGSPQPRGLDLMEEQIRLAGLLVNAALEHTIIAAHTDRLPVHWARVGDQIARALQDIKAAWEYSGAAE